MFYLTAWAPAARRSQLLAIFLTSTALSGVIGTPMAGWLMQMEGIAGLHGWQWLFLLEGLPAVGLGIVILFSGLLPDSPADADWLTPTERTWIENELARDHSQTHVNHIADLRAAAGDRRLWLFSGIYFTLIMGLYGFIYWVPTIVKSLTKASNVNVGLISAIPYVVAAISMVAIGAAADYTGRRRWIVSICAIVGCSEESWRFALRIARCWDWRRCASRRSGSSERWGRSGRCRRDTFATRRRRGESRW